MLVKLGDHCDFLGGYAFKSTDLKETSGIPVIKIKNVNNKVVSLNDVQFFSPEGLTENLKKFLLDNEDVLIAMTGQGSVGRVGRFYKADDSAVLLNQRVGKFLPKKTLDLGFLYYVLSSNYYEKLLFDAASGSGQPNLSPSIIKSIEIPFIPLTQQKRVSTILGDLDKKILLNQHTNQVLEQMAQALFKSWFVDFDPVIDNALAAGNTIPDELQERAELRKTVIAQRATNPKVKGLPDNIQQLFPSEFEDSELGWIPKGWKLGKVEDYLILQRGFDLPKNNRNKGPYPLMASSGQDGFHSEYKVEGPGIVTGRSGKLGVTSIVFDDFWPLNTTLWIKKYVNSNPYHAYFFLKTIPLEEFNSGSAVPTLNRNHVHNYHCIVAPKAVVEKFASLTRNMFFKIDHNSNESVSLSKIRDTLLPKLISGELDLSQLSDKVS